jgi:hypothetical protein
LVAALLQSTTEVAVDTGFSLNEASNRSQIGSEYIRYLAACPLASAALTELAIAGRVRMVDTKVPDKVRRVINTVVGDKSDRVFAKVTHNTRSQTLCSHDYKHLPLAARAKLGLVGISVVSAAECLGRD